MTVVQLWIVMLNSKNHLFRRLLIFMAIAPLLSQSLEAREEVILLHGLCRTSCQAACAFGHCLVYQQYAKSKEA